MQDVTILHAGARIGDKDMLERLLASIPEPDQVRPRLGAKFELWLYQEKTRREVWIVSDGEAVNAYTVLDVTPEESSRIRETRKDTPDLDIDGPRCMAVLVNWALGFPFATSGEPVELGMTC